MKLLTEDMKNRILTLARTKAQVYVMRQMSEIDLILYAASLQGRKVRIDPKKVRNSRHNQVDVLVVKHQANVSIFNQRFNAAKEHTPVDKKQDYFGVEIECFIPKNAFPYHSSECQNCGGSGTETTECEHGCEHESECSSCEGSGNADYLNNGFHQGMKDLLSQKKIAHCTVKNDSSIGCFDANDYFSVEVTCLSRVADMSNLEKLCALLNKLGAQVNLTCGLHIHLDARHLTEVERAAQGNAFQCLLPVLASMVPKSRVDGNAYNKLKVSSVDRYSAVNMTGCDTIEVRMHSASTSFIKISNWVNLLNIVRDYSGQVEISGLDELCNIMAIPNELQTYFAQRIKLFSRDSEASVLKSDVALAIDADDQEQENDLDITIVESIQPNQSEMAV